MITSTNPVPPPDLVQRIRELVAACGPAASTSDAAIVAIKLCILEGIDAKDHIVASLMRAGFDNRQAGGVLLGNRGRRPESGHLRLGADGRYRLHEEQEAG